jgi:hypothetical protein
VSSGAIPEEEVIRGGIPSREIIEFSPNLYSNVMQVNALEHFCHEHPSIEWDINEAMRATYFA